jgi:hypothetical protein
MAITAEDLWQRSETLTLQEATALMGGKSIDWFLPLSNPEYDVSFGITDDGELLAFYSDVRDPTKSFSIFRVDKWNGEHFMCRGETYVHRNHSWG